MICFTYNEISSFNCKDVVNVTFLLGNRKEKVNPHGLGVQWKSPSECQSLILTLIYHVQKSSLSIIHHNYYWKMPSSVYFYNAYLSDLNCMLNMSF